MTIILDLDDVLANLREILYRTLHRATGRDVHWRGWRHYDLSRHFSLENAMLEALLQEQQVLQHCDPEPGAARTTARLRELGYTLAIVTARGWHPQADALTEAWLERHGIGYDTLHVVPLGGDKVGISAGLRDVRLAVDDHPNNIRRYHAAGIPALMVQMPWNADADFPGVPRIASLDDLVAHADRLARD